jgi:uncharacterized protein YeaC (DUF1315 family)
MDYSQAVGNLSQDVINKLQLAIETGRWESGEKITPEQLESSMQAVMFWQAQHLKSSDSEPFVVGPNGELFTGKGESHKSPQAPKYNDADVIIKKKV